MREAQTRITMDFIRNILAGFGATMDDLVMTKCFYMSDGTPEALHANLADPLRLLPRSRCRDDQRRAEDDGARRPHARDRRHRDPRTEPEDFQCPSCVLVMLLAAFAFALGAPAQPYPNRPVKLVVPWPTGGAVDTIGRLVAQNIAEPLGQPVVIDNRAGAAGAIGSEFVAKAPPDGYTLLMGSTTVISVNPALQRLRGALRHVAEGLGALTRWASCTATSSPQTCWSREGGPRRAAGLRPRRRTWRRGDGAKTADRRDASVHVAREGRATGRSRRPATGTASA